MHVDCGGGGGGGGGALHQAGSVWGGGGEGGCTSVWIGEGGSEGKGLVLCGLGKGETHLWIASGWFSRWQL